jgi:hypothetical protein
MEIRPDAARSTSVVVSGSRLSRLPAQKGHPSTKRACLRKPQQQQA